MIERLVGVEEEFLLVDVSGKTLRAPRCPDCHGGPRIPETSGNVENEFKREQVETSTPPCVDLAQLAAHLGL